MRVVVEADGGSRGNPGPAGYGAVVLDATGAVLAERSDSIGVATNNVAEYRGLIAGLTAARELGASDVSVRMDSKLVVEQMSGRWQVKHPAMRPLHRAAGEVARAFDTVTYSWIPRAENARADRLANEAMDRAAAGRKAPPVAERPAEAPRAETAPTWVPPAGAKTRLVLVRHGSTAHSAAMRFSGRNDLALNDVGEAQAAALAKRAYGDVHAVISSPLRRCVQTAETVATSLGLDVELDDRLIETDFGTWEGLTFAEAAARDPDLLASWRNSPGTAPPGGEAFAAVGERVRRAQETIVAARPGQRVLVVTHVTPIKLLVRFALDAPPAALFRIHLDTASVSVIDYFADGNRSLRLLNDTSHLLIR